MIPLLRECLFMGCVFVYPMCLLEFFIFILLFVYGSLLVVCLLAYVGSLQSQYEEYREKYRLFDMALFCMPPDHKLRKFCRTILTSQMKEPASLKETERQGIIKTVFQTTLYLIR